MPAWAPSEWYLAWEQTNAYLEQARGRSDRFELRCEGCSMIQFQGRTLIPSRTVMYTRPKSKPAYFCGECLFRNTAWRSV